MSRYDIIASLFESEGKKYVHVPEDGVLYEKDKNGSLSLVSIHAKEVAVSILPPGTANIQTTLIDKFLHECVLSFCC